MKKNDQNLKYCGRSAVSFVLRQTPGVAPRGVHHAPLGPPRSFTDLTAWEAHTVAAAPGSGWVGEARGGARVRIGLGGAVAIGSEESVGSGRGWLGLLPGPAPGGRGRHTPAWGQEGGRAPEWSRAEGRGTLPRTHGRHCGHCGTRGLRVSVWTGPQGRAGVGRPGWKCFVHQPRPEPQNCRSGCSGKGSLPHSSDRLGEGRPPAPTREHRGLLTQCLHPEPGAEQLGGGMGRASRSCCPRRTPSHPTPGGRCPQRSIPHTHTTQARCHSPVCSREPR